MIVSFNPLAIISPSILMYPAVAFSLLVMIALISRASLLYIISAFSIGYKIKISASPIVDASFFESSHEYKIKSIGRIIK